MPSIELVISILSACVFATIAILQAFAARRKDKLVLENLKIDGDAAKALAATNVVGLAGVLAKMLSDTKGEVLEAVQAVADQLKAHAHSDEENITKVYKALECIQETMSTPKIVTSTPITNPSA